jgi:hypothetical protein
VLAVASAASAATYRRFSCGVAVVALVLFSAGPAWAGPASPLSFDVIGMGAVFCSFVLALAVGLNTLKRKPPIEVDISSAVKEVRTEVQEDTRRELDIVNQMNQQRKS